ncbi:MAG: hypothetical protein HY747_00045 [Elusimicrobia bacterium]|nr:hypothetical protein [Elusimicrobiota bacterium]
METTATQQTREFIPRNFDIFAGLDVDKSSISVNLISHEQAVKSIKIPHEAGNLISYVRKNFQDQRIAFAYETGPTGWGLYDRLAQERIKMIRLWEMPRGPRKF